MQLLSKTRPTKVTSELQGHSAEPVVASQVLSGKVVPTSAGFTAAVSPVETSSKDTHIQPAAILRLQIFNTKETTFQQKVYSTPAREEHIPGIKRLCLPSAA